MAASIEYDPDLFSQELDREEELARAAATARARDTRLDTADEPPMDQDELRAAQQEIQEEMDRALDATMALHAATTVEEVDRLGKISERSDLGRTRSQSRMAKSTNWPKLPPRAVERMREETGETRTLPSPPLSPTSETARLRELVTTLRAQLTAKEIGKPTQKKVHFARSEIIREASAPGPSRKALAPAIRKAPARAPESDTSDSEFPFRAPIITRANSRNTGPEIIPGKSYRDTVSPPQPADVHHLKMAERRQATEFRNKEAEQDTIIASLARQAQAEKARAEGLVKEVVPAVQDMVRTELAKADSFRLRMEQAEKARQEEMARHLSEQEDRRQREVLRQEAIMARQMADMDAQRHEELEKLLARMEAKRQSERKDLEEMERRINERIIQALQAAKGKGPATPAPIPEQEEGEELMEIRRKPHIPQHPYTGAGTSGMLGTDSGGSAGTQARSTPLPGSKFIPAGPSRPSKLLSAVPPPAKRVRSPSPEIQVSEEEEAEEESSSEPEDEYQRTLLRSLEEKKPPTGRAKEARLARLGMNHPHHPDCTHAISEALYKKLPVKLLESKPEIVGRLHKAIKYAKKGYSERLKVGWGKDPEAQAKLILKLTADGEFQKSWDGINFPSKGESWWVYHVSAGLTGRGGLPSSIGTPGLTVKSPDITKSTTPSPEPSPSRDFSPYRNPERTPEITPERTPERTSARSPSPLHTRFRGDRSPSEKDRKRNIEFKKAMDAIKNKLSDTTRSKQRERWMREVEDAAILHYGNRWDVNPDSVRYALFAVSPEMRELYRIDHSLQNSERYTWPAFRKWIQEHTDREVPDEAEENLKKLIDGTYKQNKTSLHQYRNAFQRICTYLPNLPESQRIVYFQNGLNDKLRPLCLRDHSGQRWTDLDKLVQHAAAEEIKMKESDRTRQSDSAAPSRYSRRYSVASIGSGKHTGTDTGVTKNHQPSGKRLKSAANTNHSVAAMQAMDAERGNAHPAGQGGRGFGRGGRGRGRGQASRSPSVDGVRIDHTAGPRKDPFKFNEQLSNEQAGYLQVERRCWHCYVPMTECIKTNGRCSFQGRSGPLRLPGAPVWK